MEAKFYNLLSNANLFLWNALNAARDGTDGWKDYSLQCHYLD